MKGYNKAMSEKASGKPEKFWRVVRDINILSAAVLAAAGVVLVPIQSVLYAGAAINGAQAFGAETIRRSRKNKAA